MRKLKIEDINIRLLSKATVFKDYFIIFEIFRTVKNSGFKLIFSKIQ
jgi:hypothetical protein